MIDYLQDRYSRASRSSPTYSAAGPGRSRKDIGTLQLRPASGADAVRLEVRAPSSRALLTLVEKARRLLDLRSQSSCRSRNRHGRDPLLRSHLDRRPGLRLPGAWDPFELSVRAILGQQVSVAGATTLAGRLAERFGRPLPKPVGPLCRLFPRPADLVGADIAAIGMPRTRGATIAALAQAVDSGELDFDRLGPHWEEHLQRLPGIGEWTAQYIGMRALGEPDAFPASDLGLLRAVDPSRATTPRQLRERAEKWRPWRAYAAVYLWAGENG